MSGVTPSLILVQIMSGVALGSIYTLVALGLTIIFGFLGVVNFAHGALFMLGAYIGVFVAAATHNFLFGLLAAPLLVGFIGIFVERLLIRPLQGRGIEPPLLMTFGLSIVLVDLVRISFGASGVPFGTPAYFRGAADLGFGYFPLYRLFIIAVTAVLVIALWVWLEKTRYGLLVRASILDPEIVSILGANVGRIWLLVFAVGVCLAGFAGVLAAPIFAVTPDMGVPVMSLAFVVTVVGGMGSILGAVVGGVLIGVVFSLTALFLPEMAELSVFALMALVLMFRPQGLLGARRFAR